MISAGYGDAERIGRMTQRQILLHYNAQVRRRSRERAEAFIDTNLAFAGGDKAQEHFKLLQK